MPIHRADGSVIPDTPATPPDPIPSVVYITQPVPVEGIPGPEGPPGPQGPPGELPDLIEEAAAVLAEDGSGGMLFRRLYLKDILPDFAIASFAKTAPNGATLLYRRGDTLTGIAVALSYVSGPPTGVVVSHAFSGSTSLSDVDPGSWTCNSPFATATLAGTYTRLGADAGSDPLMVISVAATKTGFPVVNASFTIRHTSDIYWGTTTASSIVGTDIYNGSLQSGWNGSLQQDRHRTGMLFTGTNKYHWFVIPNEAQYTTGFVPLTSLTDSNNQPFAMASQGTVSITRNGVTRTYNAYRSDLLSSSFTVES